jgi:hypothetical protein
MFMRVRVRAKRLPESRGAIPGGDPASSRLEIQVEFAGDDQGQVG